MTLKRHHKIVIGGFSAIIIIFMIVSGILLNVILTRQNLNYNELNKKIDNLNSDTQSKFNELSENIIQNQEDLRLINTQVGSINKEFENLKASVSADFSGVIENAVKSIVTVRTDIGQGTGFIVSNDGYIVTNAHVISGGKNIEVINNNQEIISAEYIGYDENLDLALMKISGNYKKINFADSNEVSIGEKVIAIGNPLGLQFSASEGIISGIHRTGPNGLNAYIQTDAALNPGNSGGPLIDKDGNVVGINNFKVGGSENLGFALESNYIQEGINSISRLAINESIV